MATLAIRSMLPRRMAASDPRLMRDVQGLRAIAVLAVVVYHFVPARVPGGYVGVDVFFVISGFLITSHLLRELERSDRIDVLRFWGRRVRRLIPAAFVVLCVTVVLVFLVLPPSQQTQNLKEVVAATFYVENWVLAADSVDYLASTNAPSLVQHYWSLSVEEQFYLLWPVLFLGALAVGGTRRGGTAVRRVGVLIAFVVAISFAYGVFITLTNPSWAYFATPARAWEFGIGALVAVTALRARAERLPDGVRIALSWVGVAAIGIACFGFTAATAFPGYAAGLPVVGTALVIVGGEVQRIGSTTWFANSSVVQWLGSISYSLYLWHWPAVVILPIVLPELARDPVILVAVFGLLLVVSDFSKRFVEDRFRSGGASVRSLVRSAFAPLAISMVVLTAVSVVGIRFIGEQSEAQQNRAAEVADCLGAAREFSGEGCDGVVGRDDVFPLPAGRLDDTELYECWSNEHEYGPVSCSFGPESAEIKVALVGDSHAASLVPALAPVAEGGGWRLDTYLGIQCQPGQAGCRYTDHFTQQILDGGYDAVLVSGYRNDQPSADELVAAWATFTEQGIQVIPVVDVPHISEEAYACLDRSNQASVLEACSTPRDVALESPEYLDRYREAGERIGAPIVDLTDWMCDDAGCPAVINNTIVYRDYPVSHLTATFARSLAPAMAEALTPIIDQLPRATRG